MRSGNERHQRVRVRMGYMAEVLIHMLGAMGNENGSGDVTWCDDRHSERREIDRGEIRS